MARPGCHLKLVTLSVLALIPAAATAMLAQPFQAVFMGLGSWGAQAGKPVPPGSTHGSRGRARAGVLWGKAGRREGRIRFASGAVAVGGRTVGWDKVVYLVGDQSFRSVWAPEAVRLADGELWRVKLLAFSAGKLKVRSRAFGEREVGASLVAALDFRPDLPRLGARAKPAALYRESGEPIPGQLLWIDHQRLALDSPLGVLTLARRGNRRYVFRSTRPAPAPHDEVSLVDGSILRGEAALAEGALTLRHSVLGELVLPGRLVRSVLRHPPGVVHLAEATPSRVEAQPLIANPAEPMVLEYLEEGPSVGWPGELRAIRAIRIEPKAEMRFRLPRGGTLRTTVGPVARAAGRATLTIASRGRKLLEKTIGPDGESEPVEVGLGPGGELAIAVDFAPPMRFPCGVVLLDPYVVAR